MVTVAKGFPQNTNLETTENRKPRYVVKTAREETDKDDKR